jgi:putative Ca2+/H+ antiporter (TMEM165/GDT1 family)
MRGGALLVGSFLAAFTCFLPGVLLAHALARVWPSHAADLAIASVYLITTGAMACILSTMSEREIVEISGNPYID